MDNVKVGRNKKSDKAKETYERNGGFSQKHVRIATLLAARRMAAATAKATATNTKEAAKGSK